METADYKTENKLMGTRNSRTDEVMLQYDLLEEKRGDKRNCVFLYKCSLRGSTAELQKK